MRPSTSLIVVAHNHARFLKRCLDSISTQTLPPDEVILCDDASTDESPRQLAGFAAANKGAIETKLLLGEKNEGLAAVLNRAFASATGEWWTILSGDDFAFDHRLERTVAEARNFPDCRLVCSNAQVVDAAGMARHPYFSHDQGSSYTAESLGSSLVGVLGATASVHRDVWSVFGDIPRSIYQEDLVLPFRAALIGTVRYIGEELVGYRYHGGNLHFDGFDPSALARHFARPGWAVRRAMNLADVARCRLADLERAVAMGRIDAGRAEVLRKLCRQTLQDAEVECSAARVKRWRVPAVAARAWIGGTAFRRCLRILTFYGLPGFYALLAAGWARLSRLRRR